MNLTLFVEQVKFRFMWRPRVPWGIKPTPTEAYWHWNEENRMDDDDADFDLGVVRDGD